MERNDPTGQAPAPAQEGASRVVVAPYTSAPHAEGEVEDRSGDDRLPRDAAAIRAEDTEPYVGLQYVARLFKVAAMVVIVALLAEIVAGVVLEGIGALLPLMTEVIRGVVLSALLWGAGDLTLLLIDVGHDVRAARVLLGRLSARAALESELPPRPGRDR